MWIEGSEEYFRQIQEKFHSVIESGQLHTVQSFVTKDNINSIFLSHGFSGDIDLLSIDIDGNDYWVWKDISAVSPRVVVIEYNGKFSPSCDWKMAYDPVHVWDGSDCQGASLKPLELLGREKGYQLIGTNIRGVNAFFVKEVLAKNLFLRPATAENLYNPARFHIQYSIGHPAKYCLLNGNKPKILGKHRPHFGMSTMEYREFESMGQVSKSQIKHVLDLSDSSLFENWNELEQYDNGTFSFRWSTESSKVYVMGFDGNWFSLKIVIAQSFPVSISVLLDGKGRAFHGDVMFSGQEIHFFVPRRTEYIVLETAGWRPCDAGDSQDSRTLGVAVSEVCFYACTMCSGSLFAMKVDELSEQVQSIEMARYVERMRDRFRVMDVEGTGEFVRMGGPNDGGYVMWNDFSGIRKAYSLGIDGDVSWDLAMAQKGIEIYMYDHTIEGPKETHPKFHFFPKGIAGTCLAEHPELDTLEHLIEENGHKDDNQMILKMDIEGCERDVLSKIGLDTLRHFSQILIEFHGLCNMGLEHEISVGLDKLNALHQLVHVHGNNFGEVKAGGGYVLPDVLEATYLRRDLYVFRTSSRYLPGALDAPNNPQEEEIVLGYWG